MGSFRGVHDYVVKLATWFIRAVHSAVSSPEYEVNNILSQENARHRPSVKGTKTR